MDEHPVNEPPPLTCGTADLRMVYDLAAEFGPDRGTPLTERVYGCLPHLNEGQVAAAIARVHAIEAAAWTLAERVWDDEVGTGQAKAELARAFPELGGDRVARAMGQAMAWVMR